MQCSDGVGWGGGGFCLLLPSSICLCQCQPSLLTALQLLTFAFLCILFGFKSRDAENIKSFHGLLIFFRRGNV